MGATVPKYLEKMLQNIENGKTIEGKPSNWHNPKEPAVKSLKISKEDDRFVKVVHFGTTILDLDFWGETPEEKVTYCYIESIGDAKIINAVLGHYGLGKELTARYGRTNGPAFIIEEIGKDVYSKWR